MVESLTYKYINGNLAQEYAANWKVESQNLPSGSTLETSEVPSQLTITVPANNTSSTRSGKIVLLQPASGKRITLNYSQPTSIQNNGIIIYVYSDPDPSTQGKGVIQVVADHPVASNISIVMYIQYGVSSGDKNQYNLTLAKGQYLLNQKFDIQIGAHPQVLSYDYQFLETGTIPAGGVIQVPQNTWADNGGDTAIYTLYLKGSEIKAGSTFYFQCRFYAINGWEGLLVDPEYNKALNYKIDTVQPSWNPSGTIQSGTIYLYKGNLSPSDFSGGILIELTLGTEINGYVKKAMIRVKVN